MDIRVVTPFVVLVIAFTQVLGQTTTNLLCYDCDPRNNNESCQNPVLNQVSHAICDDRLKDRHPNSTLLCASAFITFTGNQVNETGIYRGCYAQAPTVTDFCDWLKQETDSNNGVLTNCSSCNTTRCNTMLFNNTATNVGCSMAVISLTAILATVLFLHFVIAV